MLLIPLISELLIHFVDDDAHDNNEAHLTECPGPLQCEQKALPGAESFIFKAPLTIFVIFPVDFLSVGIVRKLQEQHNHSTHADQLHRAPHCLNDPECSVPTDQSQNRKSINISPPL